MDVAELRSIYTASSAEFDRVTDHVQRRLKETQSAAQAASETARRVGATMTMRMPDMGSGVRMFRQVEAEAKKAANGVDREWKKAQAEIKRMERERLQIASQNTKAIEDLARREANTRVREARRALTEIANSLKPMQQRGASGGAGLPLVAGAVGGIAALVGFSAVSAIRQGAAAWFEYSSKLEATRIAFTTMLGSAQAAEAHLQELQQFALKTPFEFPDLVEASQRMQALGFKADQVVPILKDVGNAVAAAGGGSERLDRVVLALSQMQSKGKVATQEMNQLAESGLPAWKILEQQFGKTRAELVKLVEGGKISADVFLQAFRTFSQNNFGDLMEKQSKTAIGALSNLKDTILQVADKALKPLFNLARDGLLEISNNLIANQSSWTEWGQHVSQIVADQIRGIAALIKAVRDIDNQLARGIGLEGVTESVAQEEARFEKELGGAGDLRFTAFFLDALRRKLSGELDRPRTGTEGGEFAVPGVILDAEGRPVGTAAPGKPPALPSPGGGKGRGADPAETARRMAQLSLQATLQGLQAEHDALQRQLDQNFVAREKYTTDAINLELKRRQATIEGLQTELSAAEKIRKPDQRLIKVAEINSRIKEEERRSAKEIQQITDEAAAEQIRIGQATAQSQLRIIETQTEQVKARIRDYAEFRMITEQRAAEWEQQQMLRVFTARERILRQELKDAGANAEKQNEARNKIKELDEERKAFIEESSRRIEAAIRRDAEHVIEFAAQIRDAFQRAAAVRMEAREADLEPLRNSILTRHQLWDAELNFEIERERQRHNAIIKGLKDEAALARIRIKNEEELAATLRGIRAQAQAEEELHQARLRQLNTQAAEQRRQEMLQVADDLASIASDIFDAIGKSSNEFWKSLKQSAVNFAKQIRDELLKGFLEKLITGQAEGAEGLIGMIINPLLGARGPNAAVADNTKATQANTDAVNALTRSMGGTPSLPGGGLGEVLHLIPGLFGGQRAGGGSAEAGKVYQIHDNEFFRPNISGKIYNLDQMNQALNQSSGEVRTIVALGDDAVGEAMESHRLTPQGRRAAIVRGRWNRKIGGLQFV